MENKTNISKKKVIRFMIGAVTVCLFGGLLIASSLKHRNSKVHDINIILPDTGVLLMPKESFKKILTSNELSDYENLAIKDLNLEAIEGVLESSPWISRAEAYIDNNKMLQLEIYQNRPVARVFTQTGGNFFIDTAKVLLPTNVTLPVSIPVFTNVPQLSEDEQSLKYKSNIAYLGAVIAADSFWNAQITQIEMMQDGTFEMMTLMGNQRIKFGDTTRAAEKLSNLFLFYNKALTKLGWDRYNVIDIRYKGQVVTSPAMGYVAPIVSDTAIDLPDPEEGEAPVSHVPQVAAATPSVQHTAIVAGTAPGNRKAAPTEKKAAPGKEPVKKAETKKVPPKAIDNKKTAVKPAAVTNKAGTAKEDKSKIKQQPKHLLPSKK